MEDTDPNLGPHLESKPTLPAAEPAAPVPATIAVHGLPPLDIDQVRHLSNDMLVAYCRSRTRPVGRHEPTRT